MSSVYSQVKELPLILQRALKSIGYYKKDISIEGKETVSVQDSGGDGRRGFVVLVDLVANSYRKSYGSWGGANMFTANVVDSDDKEHAIPPNGAVITGCEGGGHPTLANLYLHPSNIVKFLPPKVELTDAERIALEQMSTLKPGYRDTVPPPVLASLLTKGLAKQNKAGAVQITTAGKTAWRNTVTDGL